MMAANELKATLDEVKADDKSHKADMKDPKGDDLPTFKTSHNNPKEVAQYLHDVTTLVDTFMESMCRFNHYAKQDAYKYFVF